MRVYIDNHTFHYEIENLCRLFFPNEKIEIIKDFESVLKPCIFTSMQDEISVEAVFEDFCKSLLCKKSDENSENELKMAQLLYNLLSEYTNIKQPWGLLTGVRPIKLMRRLSDSCGEEEARRYFKESLFVSDDKVRLAAETEKNEKKILDLSEKMSFSLYISIPFCPTRCSYCSFVSQSIEKAKHLMQPYTQLLCEELKYTAQIVKELGLRLETVYMGGGTPTSLSASQLDFILSTVKENFDLSSCREFTVEAGRPDTITKEKLIAIKQNGADRISINPQTLNDDVLKEIGRRHTSKQTLDAYSLAREAGFRCINTDLIAGLPTDTLESFEKTLDAICTLVPENITVHTLSMKRSSSLTEQKTKVYRDEALVTADMLSYAQKKLYESGYIPYYLYRQSKMVGNLENTGWSKNGFESLYNVFVMDETHTVIGCGAGAVTKLKDYKSEYLKRIFNFKFPYEYNTRFEEMLTRKDEIKEFYKVFFGI